MSKYIWLFRYALYMHRKSGMRFKWCWESAKTSMTECMEPGEWKTESPIYAAQEEMYCWSD